MPAYIYPDESRDHLVTRTGHQTITGRKIFSSASATDTPLSVKAFAGNTAHLMQWQQSDDVVTGYVAGAGWLGFRQGVFGSSIGLTTNSHALQVVGAASSTVASMKVQAGTSQTGNLQEWQNASAAMLAAVNSNGSFVMPTGTPLIFTNIGVGTYQQGVFYNNTSGMTFETPRATESSTGTKLPFTVTSRGGIGASGGFAWDGNALYAQMAPSQTADIFQIKNSAANNFVRFSSTGALYTSLQTGLGANVGDESMLAELTAYTANTSNMRHFFRRRVAGGGWENADFYLQRKTDATFQQALIFEGGTNNVHLMTGSNDAHGTLIVKGRFALETPATAGFATNVGNSLQMRGMGNSPQAGAISFGDSTGWLLEFYRSNGGTRIAYMNDTGSWYAANYFNISTRDTKEDIVYLSDSGRRGAAGGTTTDKIKKLRAVSYKPRGVKDGPTLYSFVAEEAAEVMPEIVGFTEAGPDKGKPAGINLSALVTMQTAVIQELLARVEALEAK